MCVSISWSAEARVSGRIAQRTEHGSRPPHAELAFCITADPWLALGSISAQLLAAAHSIAHMRKGSLQKHLHVLQGSSYRTEVALLQSLQFAADIAIGSPAARSGSKMPSKMPHLQSRSLVAHVLARSRTDLEFPSTSATGPLAGLLQGQVSGSTCESHAAMQSSIHAVPYYPKGPPNSGYQLPGTTSRRRATRPGPQHAALQRGLSHPSGMGGSMAWSRGAGSPQGPPPGTHTGTGTGAVL
ncbi:hypothetical protein TgHK011_005107 [Trichoderma gracile]|nr:hypothetical protein TgHK011_005107 [Trichoderma gracile]